MIVGSLCTGYGGLDLAIGGELVFVSDIDRHANTVIDTRFPGVPNLGDLTDIDGADLPEIDVLTAGFPCQPVSQAGRRAGTEDERWLWDDIERILGQMGRPPGVVFLENVRGLLSANGGDAMARVVEGLAGLGFVGSYRVLAASDVGACHRRERVFVLAVHPDGLAGTPPFPVGGRPGPLAQPGAIERTVGSGGGTVATDSTGARRSRPRRQPPGWTGPPSSRGRPYFGPYAAAVERWAGIIGRPAPPPTDTSSGRSRETSENNNGICESDPDRPVPGRISRAGRRLNPRFVEWMMGLPDGWVTDCDIPRTAQLKILGNGVVPQQARAAWEVLNG